MHFPILLQDYLAQTASRFPDKTAIICDAVKWTYASLEKNSTCLAHCLVKLGIQRQDRIVIFLDNSAETIISLFGILKSGAIFVILNGALKPNKLKYILEDSGSRILITHTSKARVVEKAFREMQHPCKILWLGDDDQVPTSIKSDSCNWNSLLTTAEQEITKKSAAAPVSNCIDQDLAALIYTSGSTGEPKGVMSTHLNMISAAKSIIQYLQNNENDIILNVLPLSFDYGLYQMLMAIIFGGTVILEKSFLYIYQVLDRIEKENVTGFPIVPTILSMILKLKDVPLEKFKSLRYISNTGAALPVQHIKKLRTLLPQVQIYSMFGLTECKRVCYLPPDQIDKRPASVGKAMPNCEVKLLDEHGKEVPPGGEIGELVIRGTNVMQGYWNAPELTSRFFRPGKFPGEKVLYSGDFFYMDADGYLYFLGRKDDMIKSRGERISAREIENVLHDFESVAEAAVIGIPDEILGQAIKAFIVRKSGEKCTEKDIMLYCKENLEPYALPKFIEFRNNLPKTANGKIDKKLLKEQSKKKSA